ncbi:MAG: DUF6273 domain-containing protein [Synergistes sp.]|nr:DUF6273 domain-containing protein [Synergistes sp.]
MSIEIRSPSTFPTVSMGTFVVPNGAKPADLNVRLPLEWYVLTGSPESHKMLLLSRYAIDWELFGGGVDWEGSYLREWLNGTFYQESFSDEERGHILAVDIPAAAGDKTTRDHIFLLSEQEWEQYLAGKPESAAQMLLLDPNYAKGKGADGLYLEYQAAELPCWWWTRTPDVSGREMRVVTGSGELSELHPDADEVGVRPAMWIVI